jgi:hypothetical protein
VRELTTKKNTKVTKTFFSSHGDRGAITKRSVVIPNEVRDKKDFSLQSKQGFLAGLEMT